MIHLFAFLVQYHTIQKLLLFIKDALLTSLRPVPLKNRKSMSSPAPQKLTKPVGCNEAKLIANTGGNYRKFSFRGGKMRKSISFRLLYSFWLSCWQKDKFKCDVFLDHKVVFQPSPRPTHPWYRYVDLFGRAAYWINFFLPVKYKAIKVRVKIRTVLRLFISGYCDSEKP